MALLLAGSALGIAGCAQQRTEGYYDPPAESTVTDAQSQGSGAGYRTVLRAPSQVQIALKPDASRKTASQQAQAAQAGHTTEDGQPVPEGADSGAASGVAASGAAPAPAVPASTPAPPRTASCRSRRPTWARCPASRPPCSARRSA